MKKHWGALFLSLCCCLETAASQTPCKHRIASGSEDGNYSWLADAIVTYANGATPDCPLENLQTSGSYENARLLRDHKVDIALMQSDVAYLEHFEERPYVALAAVYTEPIHVIARRELGLKKLSDLTTSPSTFDLAVGPPGSGTNSHALAIVDQIERQRAPDAKPFILHQLPTADALEGLQMRTIDIVFLTSAVPVVILKQMASDHVFILLDFGSDIVSQLANSNPFLTHAEIPFAAYGVNKRSVRTLGVKTLLVARPDLPPELVRLILEGVYEIADRFREDEARPRESAAAVARRLFFLTDLVPEIGLEDVPIPIHPAAMEFHRENSNSLFYYYGAIRAYALPVIILLTPFLIFLRLSKVAYFVHQFVLGRILVLLIAIWLLGSAGMYLIERSSNSNFHTFGISTIAILHYLFSGLEAKEPITVPGNILAIVILSLGVAVATLFTATLVTILVEKALNVRRLKLKPWRFLELKDHVVIVGWSGRVERIIRQLRSRDLPKRPSIVVVSEDVAHTNISNKDILRNTWMVEDRTGLRAALQGADLRNATAALVLGEDACSHRADLEAITHALAIEGVAPGVRAIVEVQRTSNREHLQSVPSAEVIDSELLGERLISQCIITPGLVEVYDELLTFGVGSQEAHWIPVPPYLDGKEFHEIRKLLAAVEVIPIGYQRQRGSVRLNPDIRTSTNRAQAPLISDKRDRPGDFLIVLADHPGIVPKRKPRKSTKEPIVGSLDMTVESETENFEKSPRQARRDVLICGWNPQSEAVIQQLTESVIRQHHRFVITVIDKAEGISQQTIEQYDNVKLVVGDASKRHVLQSVGIEEFHSMAILADHTDESTVLYSDHRSLMIALAASQLNPNLHIVVEVVKSEHREHFERIPGIEIVSVQELSEKLLAQAVISPGVMEAFSRLLTATEDSNEIYIVPIPDRWQGKTFQEIYQDSLHHRDPFIPLGYSTPSPESGEAVVVLNPRFESLIDRGAVRWRHHPLTNEDSLILIAYEEPTL